MAELDKKIQKAQTDLVQSVLDAQEKRNLERVDMLVTNAIKQLKMSRFKPDLTTCISLVYLARVSPKLFLQSNAIKDNLKSLLRRDSGPANLCGAKGKNDIVLPVLAANILLACCDSSEVRGIILAKIEQWLATNQKISDLLQHLLATICMKCPSDAPTISSLLEMRQHWLQYLEDNFQLYGPVPAHLSAEIRKLLHTETSAQSIVEYLKFLDKHDKDTFGLSQELSEFILKRPMTLDSMLKEVEYGPILSKMMLGIFIKLMKNLKSNSTEPRDTSTFIGQPNPKPPTTDDKATKSEHPEEAVKSEKIKSVAAGIDLESPEVTLQQNTTKAASGSSGAGKKKDEEDAGPATASQVESQKFIRSLYVRFANDSKTITLSRMAIEAILTLLALVESHESCREEFDQLLDSWTDRGRGVKSSSKLASVYEDFGLKTLYDLPDRIRQKLTLSTNDLLIEMGLQGASTSQLIGLLQTFATPVTTIEKLLKRLESAKDVEQIKSEIKDASYFHQLIQFYSCMGSSGANDLQKRLELTTIN